MKPRCEISLFLFFSVEFGYREIIVVPAIFIADSLPKPNLFWTTIHQENRSGNRSRLIPFHHEAAEKRSHWLLQERTNKNMYKVSNNAND